MTLSHQAKDDLKTEVCTALSLEGVIALGSLEALLDHLENRQTEGQS